MKEYRRVILGIIFILFVGTLMCLPPIPQDLEYHDFADKRMLLGIPNFWDVMSNLPMFFLGAYGIVLSCKHWAERPGLVTKLIPFFLCIGIFLACFGSAYYHWAPDNHTLVWDRLPMTFMFMPLFSLLIYDFIGKQEGMIAFFILMPLGVFSVFYWQYTESIGQGDLRFYAFVQFFPMLIAPFVLWLYPKKTEYVRYIVHILGWYVLAKFSEHFDEAIFNTLHFWSGHTIKHLLGGVSLYYALKLIVSWEKQFFEEEIKISI